MVGRDIGTSGSGNACALESSASVGVADSVNVVAGDVTSGMVRFGVIVGEVADDCDAGVAATGAAGAAVNGMPTNS